MSDPAVLHSGSLGPHAAKRLAAIVEVRARLDTQEQDILATIAEAQGFVLEGVRVKFDYDTQAGTYKVLGAPEEGDRRSTTADAVGGQAS